MSYPVLYPEAGDTVPILFTTYGGTDGESITCSGLAVTDIEIYKDGSITQRSSDAGYVLIDTDGIDIDSGVTGLHGFTLDLSDNTDAGFYAVGSWYHVVVSSITVDSQTVTFIAAMFRIVSATRGLAGTALPDAAAAAAGGLPVSTAGSLDLDAKLANTNEVTAARMGALTDWIDGGRLDLIIDAILDDTDLIDDATSGLAKIATDAAAILSDTGTDGVLVSSGTGSGQLNVSSGVVDANAVQVSGSATAADNIELHNAALEAGTAQAGSTANITLAAGASATNSFYIGDIVYLTGGTGAGQSRQVQNYTGASKVAVVNTNWAVQPDATSTYLLLPGDWVLSVVAEMQDNVITAGVFDQTTAFPLASSDGTDLTEAGGTGDHLTAIDLPNQTMDITGDITGSLSGSVGSVAGNVDGSVGSVVGHTVQTGDSYARLGAPAGASVSADVAAVKTDTGNIATRITSTLFTGITSLAEWLGLMAGKQTPDATALAEIKTTGAGSGTYDATTDALEALQAASAPTAASIADAVWDEAIAGHVGAGSTGAALNSATAPSAASVADAVWEEAIADHSGTSGSVAEQLQAAGAGGDPWNTALPGAYTSGKAGEILGNILEDIVDRDLTASSITAGSAADLMGRAARGLGLTAIQATDTDDSGDDLYWKDSGGTGISGATVRAYLTVNYGGDADLTDVEGETTTVAGGGFAAPLYLAAGAYTIEWRKAGYATHTTTITVA